MPNSRVWAKSREQFLQEAFPEKYKSMKLDGTLEAHLHDVGENAQEMYEDCQAKMMNSENLPQEYWQRVAKLEQIPEIVRELVMHEFITNPPASVSKPSTSFLRHAENTAPEEPRRSTESSEAQVTAPVGSPLWYSQVEDRALDRVLKKRPAEKKLA